MKLRNSILLACFLAALFPALCHADWQFSTHELCNLGSWGCLGQLSKPAIDAQDRPHLVWISENGEARHLYFNGSTWKDELIEKPGHGAGTGDIAVDSTGRIHAVYSAAGSPNTLKYALFDGTNWKMSEIAQLQTLATFPNNPISIALDKYQRPHISYVDGNSGVKYLRFNGKTWMSEDIPFSGTPYRDSTTAISVCSNGAPNVVYCATPDGTTHSLYWARKMAGTWRTVKVGNGKNPSMALDSSSRPHILFQSDDISKNPIYFRWSGTRWVTENVLTKIRLQGWAEDRPGLVLTPAGKAEIFFTFSEVQYGNPRDVQATFDGTTWGSAPDYDHFLLDSYYYPSHPRPALGKTKLHVLFNGSDNTTNPEYVMWGTTDF